MKSGMSRSTQILEELANLVKNNNDYFNSLDEYNSEELFDDILYGFQESINTFKLRQEVGYNSDKN